MAAKKVLVFCTQLLETGGIESHVKEFIFNMTKKSEVQMEVCVLNAQISDVQRLYFEQYSHRHLLLKGKSWLGKLKTGWFILKSAVTQYDTLYTNGQGNSIYFIAQCLRFKRWVHHHHTAGDLADQQTWSPSYIKALMKADTVVACSGKNASDIQTALNRPVNTIPCFSRAVIPCTSAKLQNGKINLGYYGRLIPEKGIDLICTLSDDPEMAHIQFHIWGEGEQYPAAFFDKCTNLHYHGAFDGKAALAKVLGMLDGYLLLSIHPEGLPISLLEAMSAGIPWLATDRGGIADIACDPLATRLLHAVEPFEKVKQEVLRFASDIKCGKIVPATQQAQYEAKFSPSVLTKKWGHILYAENQT